MYLATLNQTRIIGLRRTNASTTKAAKPLISIGQGCSNSTTDASSGINATELRTFVEVILEIGRKLESQITASIENATRPFQDCDCKELGTAQSGKNRTTPASADRKAV